MKVSSASNHPGLAAIEMVARGKHYVFPYDEMEPPPSEGNPIQKLFVDPELAREGVTYFLASGAEGAVLVDHVFSLRRERAGLGRRTRRGVRRSGTTTKHRRRRTAR